MLRGKKLEPLAAEAYEEVTGRKIKRHPESLTHKEHSFLKANIDRHIISENPEQGPGDLLTVPISGRNARFRVSVQHFPRERVLFIATHDYIRLEEVTSSNAMVLVLTQLAALNYDLLLGKFQLNPRSGEISLSVEINLDDGLGFATWSAAFAHLVRTADERYPDLMRAVQGQGL
jgi:hypothetical protein